LLGAQVIAEYENIEIQESAGPPLRFVTRLRQKIADWARPDADSKHKRR